MARHGLFLVRALLLVAVAASAMLVADYSADRPAFCAQGSGCEAVQASEYSALLGVPLPYVGLGGFAALFLLSLVRRERARALLRLALGAAGLVGVLLVVLQARVIGAVCPLCMTVDVAAIALATLAISPAPFRAERPDVLPVASYAALLVLAVAAPLVWRELRPEAPSPAAAAIFARERVRIVEVADFTCPHCRALYPRLEAARRASSPPERIHRIMIPATGHPRAVEAASAYSCAERAGEADAMAEVLFGEAALTMPANEWARGAGIEADELAACMTRDATARALAENERVAESLGIRGIPTTFVGNEVLVGAVDRGRIERALRALDREGGRASVQPLWFGFSVAALALGILGLGARAQRRRRAAQ